MQQESAELIGLKVLGWLASDEDIFPVFLGASGIAANELKERAGEVEILCAVLDFVTMDDEWVQACARATGLDPHDPMRARQALPGGAQIHGRDTMQMTGPQGQKIEAILFDKDGTLMDFQRSWGPWTAWVIESRSAAQGADKNAVAQALGFDLAAQMFHPDSAVIAGTPEDVVTILQPFFPANTPQEIVGWLDPDITHFTPAIVPGVKESCDAFGRLGVKQAVVTNDFEAAARDHLELMGLAHLFDAVIGYDSGFGGKPAAGPCLGAAERLGVAPEACVMVGDSLHDLEAGLRAGMIPVAVLTGVAGAEDLAPHAAVVLDSVADLPQWLCS